MSSMEAATASNEATTSNGVIAGPSITSLSSSSSTVNTTNNNKEPLYLQYPVGSTWDFTLSTDERIVGATVYCTDEVSDTVMIQKALAHTTLATEVRIVQSSHIVQATKQADRTTAGSSSSSSSSRAVGGGGGGVGESSAEVSFLSQPLPKIQKKALEERERRAVRLAEESFRHINQKASPEGQAVFDRLLKACNEVVWKGESIIVLNQIQVDPPYGPEHCRILSSPNGKQQGVLADSSLGRVKKIVAANSNTTAG